LISKENDLWLSLKEKGEFDVTKGVEVLTVKSVSSKY
jgi:hypothetical protein